LGLGGGDYGEQDNGCGDGRPGGAAETIPEADGRKMHAKAVYLFRGFGRAAGWETITFWVTKILLFSYHLNSTWRV
jgi:hypothetical protein